MVDTRKKLLLLRHAKSDWEAPYHTDFDRPLNTRGIASAPLIGQYAKRKNLIPDLVLCSSAKRTRQTFEYFCSGLGKDVPVEFLDGLYGADTGFMNHLVKTCDEDILNLMLIGHNPGMGAMAYHLAPEREALFGKFPTASFAAFGLTGSWQSFDFGPCKFIDFVKPRDLA